MARRLLAGVVVAVAVALGVAAAAAAQSPILRSATAADRHIVIRVAVADLRPLQLTVATSRAVDADGALPRRNVRLREAIQLVPSATGVVRWQTRKTLAPGTYFAQVTAVETGGVTDCPKFQPDCLERWSNVRRVVVVRSS